MRKFLGFTFILILAGLLSAQDETTGQVAIHGFVSQGYMKSSANSFFGNTADGTFELNEFGLNFSTELTDNLRVGVQIFARDLGNIGNDELTLDWAYGDYRIKNWLGLRGGKMKMPLGLYNEYRDLDMARVNIFMPQGVYNETWRDTFNAIKGFGLYGTVAIPFIGSFDYQGQAGVLNMSTNTGVNRYIQDQLYAKFDHYEQETTLVGNLVWNTPLQGLKLSGSYMLMGFEGHGKSEDTAFWQKQTVDAIRGTAADYGVPSEQLPPEYSDRASYEYAVSWFQQFTEANLGQAMTLDLVGIDIIQDLKNIDAYWLSAEYVFKGLTLAGEYYKLYTELRTSNPGEYGVLRNWSMNELGGFYGSAAYRFNENIETGVYYSEYYPDLSDKDGTGYESIYGFPASNGYLKDTAISIRYDVNPYWIIKAEGHFFKGTAVMFRDDQKNPYDMKDSWNLIAAKLTYNF